MGKPRVSSQQIDTQARGHNERLTDRIQMIILVRHAQSEGNKNRDIHQFIPDHRVKLTPHGRAQVRAPPFLRSPLRARD